MWPGGADMDVAEDTGEDARRESVLVDERTRLAVDRTILAFERTYTAWLRTGLAALASGVGFRPVLDGHLPDWLIELFGGLLILLGIFCFAAGAWRARGRMAWLEGGAIQPVAPALLMLVNGALILGALAALYAIRAA